MYLGAYVSLKYFWLYKQIKLMIVLQPWGMHSCSHSFDEGR